MPVERETIARLLALASVIGIGVASAVAKKPPAPPAPPAPPKPTGRLLIRVTQPITIETTINGRSVTITQQGVEIELPYGTYTIVVPKQVDQYVFQGATALYSKVSWRVANDMVEIAIDFRSVTDVLQLVYAKMVTPPTPPPTGAPSGIIARMGIDTVNTTVIAKVFVVATRGTTPITAEVTCEIDGMKQTKTITITELNREYELDFSFTVTESGTYTVTASGVLRNAYGEYSLPPMMSTISVTVYKPFTITIRAVADGREVSVPVTGLFPSGSWRTPFEIEITSALRGKVLTFEAPYSIDVGGVPYVLAAVENGEITQIGDNRAQFKVLADRSKTVTLSYARKRWLKAWIQGEKGNIYVWDCWYDTEKRKLYVDLTVEPGTELSSAAIIVKDFPTHGFLCKSGITGHQVVECDVKYTWYMNYGVAIAAIFRWGTWQEVLLIRRDEIRFV